MQTSESQILALIHRHDERAPRMLYQHHAPRLYAICCRYLCDDEDAKDALQDTFIKALQNISTFTFRGEGSLHHWLSKICSNECLKIIRQNNHFTHDINEDIISTEDEESLTDISPEIIHQFIRQLPVGYRTVLNMYVFEQMSHKDIADKLGIAPGTSMSQYSKAKGMLARLIKEYKTKER